jgi:hypothetical protein
MVPFARSAAALIGAHKGKIRVRSDILNTDLRWDASE